MKYCILLFFLCMSCVVPLIRRDSIGFALSSVKGCIECGATHKVWATAIKDAEICLRRDRDSLLLIDGLDIQSGQSSLVIWQGKKFYSYTYFRKEGELKREQSSPTHQFGPKMARDLDRWDTAAFTTPGKQHLLGSLNYSVFKIVSRKGKLYVERKSIEDYL